MAENKGLFITFEGIDGCGKSTQARKAAAFFRNLGREVLELRDPGSTAVGEAARNILLNRDHREMDSTTELLLFAVARSQMTAERILPAVKQGIVVICDRYYDSTTAYQGYGRCLNAEKVRLLNDVGSHHTRPDLTVIVDLDPVSAVGRRMKTGEEPDRMETETREFFRRVRDGFLKIARDEPGRCAVIDGQPDPETVFDHIRPLLEAMC